jgi:hypothetical protein
MADNTGWIPDSVETGWVPDDPTPTPTPAKVKETGASGFMEEMDAQSPFPRASAQGRRLALEAGGATAGAILGTPIGPQGSIAGGGLGYAGGKLAADYLEELSGTRKSPDFLGRVSDVGKDFSSGALLQGAGESGANALKMAFEWGKRKAAASGIALTKDDIIQKAKELLQSNMGKTTNPENVTGAERLAAEIPGYKPSLAESTGDADLIRLQQSLARQPGGMGTEIAHRQANRKALADYLDSQFSAGKTIDDVLATFEKNRIAVDADMKNAVEAAHAAASKVTPVEAQSAGRGIFEKVKKVMAPVLDKERELWSAVDNLPMPTANTEKAFADAIATPSTAEPILTKIQKIYGATPKTVQGLRRVELELDSAINSAGATNTEKHFLRQVKAGVQKDIEEIGSAAESGDIAMSNGQAVYPSKLKEEYASLDSKITAATQAQQPKPDIQAIQKTLQEKGIPSMKAKGETDASYEQRIVNQYKQSIGGDIQTILPEEPAWVAGMKQRQKQIKDLLDNAQPAQNVADQIKTAKNYSHQEKFSRFDRGAVRDILKQGNAPNGRRVPDAEVAGKFMTPDNADQLIKALGDQKLAGNTMEGFIASDMAAKTQNPTTKEIIPKAFDSWIKKNRVVLEKYGLTDKFKTIQDANATLETAKIAQDQFNKSLAGKMLNADPDKAIAAAFGSTKNTGETMNQLMAQMKGDADAIAGLKSSFKDFMVKQTQNTADALTGGQIISNSKIQSVLAKYDPALRRLYGADSQEYKALKNVQEAIQVSYRSIPSPLGGGSNTVEQANTALDTLAKVVGMPGLKMGPLGSFAVRAGQRAIGIFTKLSEQDALTILRRAMYDPELAKDLLMAKRGLRPDIVEKNLRAKFITMGIIGGKETIQ